MAKTVTTFTDNAVACKKLGTDVVVSQETIDFKLPLVASVATDTVNLLKIPAGSLVKSVDVVVLTAEGAAAAMEVGYSGDVDFFIDSVDLNATGANLQTAASPAGVAGGLYFAADGFITGTLTASTTNAVVKVIATYVVKE